MILVVGVAIGCWWFPVAVRAQDDDLGSQPRTPPSAADLGVDTNADVVPTTDKRSPNGDAVVPVRRAPTVDAAGAAAHAQALQEAIAMVPRDVAQLEALSSQTIQDGALTAMPKLRVLPRAARVLAAMEKGRTDDAKQALVEAQRGLQLVPTNERAEHRGMLHWLEVMLKLPSMGSLLLDGDCDGLGLAGLVNSVGVVRRARWRAMRDIIDNANIHDRFWARRLAYEWLERLDVLVAAADEDGDVRAATVGVGLLTGLVGDELAAQRDEVERALLQSLHDPASLDEPLLRALEQRRATTRVRSPATVVPQPQRKQWRLWSLTEGSVRVERFDGKDWQALWDVQGTMPTALSAELLSDARENSAAGRSALLVAASTIPTLVPRAIITDRLRGDAVAVGAAVVAVRRLVANTTVRAAVEGSADVSEWRDLLVDRYASAPPDEQSEPFLNLQRAQNSLAAHALRGLQALVVADRQLVPAIMREERLPMRERTWLIAEVADASVQPRLQELAWDRDDRVAATATWSLFKLLGAKASSYGFVRPQAAGRVGCVSRAIDAVAAEEK
jgi:hypothetical protein